MNPYILLAKSAVENYIKEKKIISPPENLPEEFLTKKSGVFVTIEKGGKLKGCIGTYLATKENITEEIISNAIAAATEDYRFGPIQKEELLELSYTVYVLNKPKLVTELNPVKWASPKIRRILFDRVNPKKYGIIIKTMPISSPGIDVVFNGHTVPKSGLLLPNLDGIDTAEQQIAIACQKGEINPEIEKIIIYKFTVEKFSDKND